MALAVYSTIVETPNTRGYGLTNAGYEFRDQARVRCGMQEGRSIAPSGRHQCYLIARGGELVAGLRFEPMTLTV